MDIVFLAFILVLSIFLGFELINKVPATLHTPLMSGSNAISGITLVGALTSAGAEHTVLATVLGTLAVAMATIIGAATNFRFLKKYHNNKKIINPANGAEMPICTNIW